MIIAINLLFSSCAPRVITEVDLISQSEQAEETIVYPTPTQRPTYSPGELVAYTAQTGDTLPALASRFNTTVEEILVANPDIPQSATTLPPGFPMRVPIYFVPLWGESFKIIPDSLFIYGPSSMDDDLEKLLASSEGWASSYIEPHLSGNLNTAQLLTEVSQHFSVSPKLLLVLLEVTSGGLSDPEQPSTGYFFGYKSTSHKGLYLQSVWLSNQLNNAYYAYRAGNLKEFEFPDGKVERPDPWLNASTAAIHFVLSKLVNHDRYDELVRQGGFDKVYAKYFGDPWANVQPHIPVSLLQPRLTLPFESGRVWNYTGGPHAGWGDGEPFAAIDFAPSGIQGCGISADWLTAMADGLVIRSQRGEVLIDLDGDGDQRTGWVLFYLHLSSIDRVPVGKLVKQGDRIGHPSCEGGTSTGTHVHIARLYNGEWINASGVIPFDLEGWVVQSGGTAYKGAMKKYSVEIRSSTKAEIFSIIEAQPLGQ